MDRGLATGRVAATAIVLAGGRSSRFGSDKLAADLDGEPLLVRAVRAVAEVCLEVLVVSPPGGLSAELPALEGVSLLRDVSPFEGPLVALAMAAPAASHDRLLLVGGDMPELQPPLLRRLLAWPDGRWKAPACFLLTRLSRCRWASIARRRSSGPEASWLGANGACGR